MSLSMVKGLLKNAAMHALQEDVVAAFASLQKKLVGLNAFVFTPLGVACL